MHCLSINKGVLALNYILMLQFEFVAQAVPHQCIAHHGAEHRAAAAAEKTVGTELSGAEGKGRASIYMAEGPSQYGRTGPSNPMRRRQTTSLYWGESTPGAQVVSGRT